MADFTLNCQTDATANPYTPAGIVVQVGAFKNVNGTGANCATNGTASQAVHNVNYGNIIQSDVTYGTTGTSDMVEAAAIVRSGANLGKGYCYYVNGTFARLAILDGTGFFVDISGTTFSYTPAAGDILTCIYTKSTGSLVGKVNGTVRSSTTDTTYQSESSLAAGFVYEAANANASIIRMFQGTGVAGANIAVLTANNYRRRRVNHV